MKPIRILLPICTILATQISCIKAQVLDEPPAPLTLTVNNISVTFTETTAYKQSPDNKAIYTLYGKEFYGSLIALKNRTNANVKEFISKRRTNFLKSEKRSMLDERWQSWTNSGVLATSLGTLLEGDVKKDIVAICFAYAESKKGSILLELRLRPGNLDKQEVLEKILGSMKAVP